MIYLAVATEDELSEEVCCRLIKDVGRPVSVHLKLRRNGFGYLRANTQKFNAMAKTVPLLLLTDLDDDLCPERLRSVWLAGREPCANFVFRVAVREVESWLLADVENLSEFFGVSSAKFPSNPDVIDDPKQSLLSLARVARREIKNDLVRSSGAAATQGLGYNRRLAEFVSGVWSPANAATRSKSLSRAMKKLEALVGRLELQA